MATIKDVAQLAGVGLGTASRAISGRGPVAPATLERVNRAVAALQFRPSNVARAMTSKKLGMVGVYVPGFEGGYFGVILQTLDAVLRRFDRHMVATNGSGGGSVDARQRALDGVEFLIQRECDGLIVVSNDLLDADLEALLRRQPRLVLLHRPLAPAPAHSFDVDHDLAGRLAARALLARGHVDIASISGPRTAPDNEARMAGFHDELRRHGVRVPRRRRMTGDFTYGGGDTAMQRLLSRGPREFSALFCANDVTAMAAISCLNRAGISVPHEVSVIGFDDVELASYTAPKLTTVRIPLADLTTNACYFTLNLCYGLALPVLREFQAELVWRDSVVDGPCAPSALRPLPA